MLRYGSVRTGPGTEVAYTILGPDSLVDPEGQDSAGGPSADPSSRGRAPVVLLHPINLRKECWLDVVRPLAGERSCVLVDLAGHGESDDARELSLGAWVADCRELIGSLGLERFHLVGGSLGGTIAICLAAELPAQVLSATALGSSVRDEPSPDGEPAPDLTELLDTRSVDELFAELAVAALAPGAPADLVTTVRRLTNSHGESVVRATLTAARRADATDWLAGVRCPVLVVTGEHDTTSAPDAGEWMAKSVGGRHERLPGTGHLPMLEDAAAVLGLLVPHLENAEMKAGAP